MSNNSQNPVSLDSVISALLDESKTFPATYLHRFSDLTPQELDKLKKIWLKVSEERRVALLEDLDILAESDTLMFFDDFCELALDDTNPRVRQKALGMLWQTARDGLIPRFIEMMTKDPDTFVRANAASSLGQFVYEGELEELVESILHEIEDALLDVLRGDDQSLVRRRALEALGYSSREEVKPFIEKAYNSDDPAWISSALFAMGRSAEEDYIPQVVESLDHPDSDVKFEAVRAAGELSAGAARGPLLDMLGEGIDDIDLRMAVVWSLSEIGGEDVRETLETLADTIDDDEEAELVNSAIDNLFFTEGFEPFNLLDFELLGEDDLENVIDLEDEGEDEDDDFVSRDD